jgi:hypothetical protein
VIVIYGMSFGDFVFGVGQIERLFTYSVQPVPRSRAFSEKMGKREHVQVSEVDYMLNCRTNAILRQALVLAELTSQHGHQTHDMSYESRKEEVV